MKTTILSVFALAFASQAQASVGSLRCESRPNSVLPKMTVIVMADRGGIEKQNDGFLADVVVTVHGREIETEAGGTDFLFADAKYKPEVYKNHSRFDLNQLTDIPARPEIGGDLEGPFAPVNTCYLDLLIPNGGFSQLSFKAAMHVDCENMGGMITLDCKVGLPKY